MVKKYTTPTHLGEYLIAYLSMEIVVWNHVFYEDHQSILHTLPPFCGRNNLCLIGLSIVFITCLSNIEFQYGVFVISAYSLPFSWLTFICLSKPWQFASKSNFHYKLQITIRFILFHNRFFFRVSKSLYSLYNFNYLDLWCFLTYPFKFELKTKLLFWTPSFII